MIFEIRKRLQALENAKKGFGLPESVIIFWDESEKQWIAKELYVRKSSKGKVIPRTGRIKLIPLNNPDDYRPPEGFRGTIIHGRVLE